MGPSASLRQLLGSLCHSTPWEYAVFWRLNHRGCMMLTWEEGYCENSKLPDPLDNSQNDEIYNDMSFSCEKNVHAFQDQYPIGLVVSRMSSHLYSLGNGIVGTVAFTGRYQWLLFTELNSKLLGEYPDEWQLQFAAGIKTILLVPVSPYGVVQLGSFESVAEDVMLVADIKDLFNSFHNTSGGFTASTSNGDDLKAYDESRLLMKNDLMGFDIGIITEKKQLLIYDHYSLPSVIRESTFIRTDTQHMLGMDMQAPYGSSWDTKSDCSPIVPVEESLYQDQWFDINDSFAIECKSSNLTPENLLFTFSQCNNDEPALFTGLSAFLNSYNSEVGREQSGSSCIADEMGQPFITEVLESASNEINGGVSDICTGSLGAGIPNEPDDCVPNSTVEDYWPISPAIHNSSISEFDEVLINEAEVECLINSLVAELYNASNEGLPNASNTVISSDDSPGNLISCCQTQSKCQSDASCVDHLGSQNHIDHVFSSGEGIAITSSPSGSSSSMNGSTLIIEEKPHQTELGTEKYNTKKSILLGKKRPKPDDNHRSRPRDRQLIQECVKELRDIVPNGKKCSIDALLDRTIKHMMFLMSVSSQAEKLRKCSRSKVLGVDHEPLEFEDENYGMTWAYELDSQPETCPIVVKDLDQQGHMLVEMLCTEYGDFLEIAQVMKRLCLTILKGVMESRAEKLWAHFVVEATKGFNRMEILWPLMQLLQQNRIPLTSRF